MAAGTHQHMFFDCSLLRSFWDLIQKHLSLIFDTPIVLLFPIVLLGPWEASIPHPLDDIDMHLLELLITIAVKVILAEWKSFNLLSYHTWWSWVSFLRGAHLSVEEKHYFPSISNTIWRSLDKYMKLSSEGLVSQYPFVSVAYLILFFSPTAAGAPHSLFLLFFT